MQHPLGKSLSVITELIMDARLPVFLIAFPDRAGAVVVGFLLDPPILTTSTPSVRSVSRSRVVSTVTVLVLRGQGLPIMPS